MHLKIAGDIDVPVDNKIFEPDLLTFEPSLKVGWYFSLKR